MAVSPKAIRPCGCGYKCVCHAECQLNGHWSVGKRVRLNRHGRLALLKPLQFNASVSVDGSNELFTADVTAMMGKE